MVRSVETVQRALAQLIEIEIMLLSGVVVSSKDKHSRGRFCTHYIVNDTGAFKKFRQRIYIHNFRNGCARGHGWTVHTSLGYPHPGGVCHNGLFK